MHSCCASIEANLINWDLAIDVSFEYDVRNSVLYDGI